MSLESSPYLPVSVSFSSITGVSMVTAPWRLKTSMMRSKTHMRMAMESGP